MLILAIPNTSLLYVSILFAVGVLMLLLAGYTFKGQSQSGTHSCGWLSVSIAVYAIFYASEVLSPTLDRALFFNKIQYIGITMIPAFAVVFVIQFIGRNHWLRGYRKIIPFIIPVITLVLKFTDQWHGLIYKDLDYVIREGMLIFSITPGFWYYIFVAYINVAMLTAAIIMFRFFLSSGGIFRKQAVIMLLGMLAPWLGHILYISGLSYMGMDSSPIYFSVFGAFMALGIFQMGLFEVLPIARDTIFDNMRDGVVVVNMKQKIVDINAAAKRIFLRCKTEVTGADARAYFSDYPGFTAFLISEKHTEELIIRTSDKDEAGGEDRIFLTKKSTLKNKRQRQIGIIISMQDITESKIVEAALLREKMNAEAANLAKSEFLANMSHEIRTPMNAILGFTETLYHRLNDPAQKKMVQSIASGGKLLLSLINDILDLSKIEAGKLSVHAQPTDVPAIVEEMQLLFREKVHQKELVFSISMDDDFPAIIEIDEVRIKQVLFNLVGNAVKFTHHGRVEVGLSFVATSPSHGEMTLVVKDTGIGIDPGQLKAIFKPFHQQSGQSNRLYGGTGLGLTISHRLLALMGGQITVSSTPGVGSTFTVQIPALPYSAARKATPSNHEEGDGDTGDGATNRHLREPLTAAQNQAIPELVRVLQESMLPTWEQLNNQLVIFKIEAFAQQLKEIAQTYLSPALLSYAETLYDQADQLDLEAMKETLWQFPDMIERIGQQYTTQG